MESVQVWHPMNCECVIHEAIDTTLGTPEAIAASIRYVTREEAVAIHNAHFKAHPETTRSPEAFPQPPHRHCPRHAKHGATPFLRAALVDESKRVEAMRAEAAARSGIPVDELPYEVQWDDSNPAGTHAPLSVRFPTIDEPQRTQVEQAIPNRRVASNFVGTVRVPQA